MPRRKTITEKQIQAPHWDAHETVLIRSLRERDNEAIQNELAEMTSGTNANMRLALGTTRLLTMVHGIVSWTLTDTFNNPLPVSQASLLDLAPEDADYIYSQINELNQPMSEDEKKASSTTADPGSLANTAEPPKQLSSVK